MGRVNRAQLRGGDTVLFARGQRFPGTLRLSPASLRGTSPGKVLTIGSYGAGAAAVIDAGDGSGILAVNVSGLHVHDLAITGTSRSCRGGSAGIYAYAKLTLDVIVHGSKYTFYVNGQRVGEARDGAYLRGTAGLVIDAGGTIDVSSFTLYNLA